MSIRNYINFNFSFSPETEKTLVRSLFFLLFLLLLCRCLFVFLIHDEIATKWSYMVHWNPLPYMGHIDANNHFVNSLFGGLFMRIFGDDSAFIIRIPNLLSFPIYFWSIYRLRHLFRSGLNFYLVLVLMTLSMFILEYFSLARGYGISIAFLLLALERTISYTGKASKTALIISSLAWTVATYANLSLLPFALIGIIHLSIISLKHDKKTWLLWPISSLFPLFYLIKYSFYLKESGKLYLGNSDGLFNTTVHSLSNYLWGVSSVWIDLILTLFFIGILLMLVLNFKKDKFSLQKKMIIPFYFILSVTAILAQHILLDINFPEQRSALHLVVLLFISLGIWIDQWKLNFLTFPLGLITLLFFIKQVSVTTSINYYFDHFDSELVSLIPEEVNGTPPTTYGGYWRMDNELSRISDYPTLMFQEADNLSDTIADFIISKPHLKSEILTGYTALFTDSESKKVLYKRNHYLDRRLIETNLNSLTGSNEFIEFYNQKSSEPLLIRLKGNLENMSIDKQTILICTAEDSIKRKLTYYTKLPLEESCSITDEHSISFDVSILINKYSDNQKIKVYLWNKQKYEISGTIESSLYSFN